MATEKDKDTLIFISYSRKDRMWVDRLLVHLKSLNMVHEIDVWEDTRLEAGDLWEEEIISALGKARIAVLLVSADFLASDFISKTELPSLLKSAEENGTIIIPMIISPCRFKETKIISQFKPINDPSAPLTSLTNYDQESAFDNLRMRIEQIFAMRVESSGLKRAKPREGFAPAIPNPEPPVETKKQANKTGKRSSKKITEERSSESKESKKGPVTWRPWIVPGVVLVAVSIVVAVMIKWPVNDQPATYPPGITSPSPPVINNPIQVKLLKDQSQKVIEELNIKLIETQLDGASNTYKVTASVSSPGFAEMKIREQDPTLDRAFFFPNRQGYKIKIVAADDESATFQVERGKS